MELDEYRDSLEFFPEYQLSSEPLRIDCVIIKKIRDVQIKKNIAAIFREINIRELLKTSVFRSFRTQWRKSLLA